MSPIKSAAVFCGARPGADPAFLRSAKALGEGFVRMGIRLVYGGGRVGMMGMIADTILAGGGAVKGVIPTFLAESEKAHAGVADMTFTDTMHVRKRLMFDQSDAFVIMPGGLGTLDETAEIITWRQLGLHDKPILICDIKGWAQPLHALFEGYIRDGFVSASSRALYEIVPDVETVLERLRSPEAPDVPDRPDRI